MILDATDLILGRFATVVAKRAIMGEKIDIVNCEKAVVTGNKNQIFQRYKQRQDRGIPLKGPYYPRMPDRVVRRAVRGMLPYKKHKGNEAFKRVMCYIGIPEYFRDKKPETINEADIKKMKNIKYITIGEICKILGAK